MIQIIKGERYLFVVYPVGNLLLGLPSSISGLRCSHCWPGRLGHPIAGFPHCYQAMLYLYLRVNIM